MHNIKDTSKHAPFHKGWQKDVTGIACFNDIPAPDLELVIHLQDIQRFDNVFKPPHRGFQTATQTGGNIEAL